MMNAFLANNRDELVERCKAKVANRPARRASAEQLRSGIPLFLGQLTRTLSAEQADEDQASLDISGRSGGSSPASSEIGLGATAHGKALLELGYSVDQVVHDYGDLCQAITELALERATPFAVDEFKTLNRCLDNAIADAVTEFSRQRDVVRSDASAIEADERMACLLHELRNALHTGHLAVDAMQQGGLSVGGATGTVLKRSLASMKGLVDGSIAELHPAGGSTEAATTVALADFIEEARVAAQLEANARGCALVVTAVDPALRVQADTARLHGALSNLLCNAFKFTRPHTEVDLRAFRSQGSIRIDVADRCGGLSQGYARTLFTSRPQQATDQSGLGIGLSIARQNVEGMGGSLTVENRPGVGCVFTIRLPGG